MPLDLYPASYDPNNPSTPAGMAPAINGLTWTVLATPEFSTLNAVESPNALDTRLPQTRNPIWHFALIYDYLYARYRSPNNTYPFAPYSDLDTMMGFYLGHGGTFGDFLFDNPKDRTARGVLGGAWQPNHIYALNDVRIDSTGHAELVTVAGTSGANEPNWFGGSTVDGRVTWTDQGYFPDGFPDAPAKLQLIDDGFGNYYTPVQRILGGVYYEDITDLNGPITVWADGVLQPTNNYTILGPGVILNDVLYAGLVLQWAAQPVAPITATFNFYFRVCFEMDTQDFEHFMDELWTIGGSGSKSGSGTVKLITARPNGPLIASPPQAPPPPLRTAIAGTVSIWTSYTNTTAGAEDCLAGVNAGDGFAGWNPGWGQSDEHSIVKTDVPYALRKDTYELAGPAPARDGGPSLNDIDQINTTGDFPISMFIYSGTPNPSVPGVFMRWYDCYIDVVYSDTSTARLRPTRSFVDVQNGVPGFGFVANPDNAFDADTDPPVTFATWTRDSMDALNFVNSLILSGFQFR